MILENVSTTVRLAMVSTGKILLNPVLEIVTTMKILSLITQPDSVLLNAHLAALLTQLKGNVLIFVRTNL